MNQSHVNDTTVFNNIDIISISSGEENFVPKKKPKKQNKKTIVKSTPKPKTRLPTKIKCEIPSKTKISHFFSIKESNKTLVPDEEEPIFYYEKKKPGTNTGEKIKHPCPEYKIIAGTTFAVDSFRFGMIEGITHYFLTHFHADHYIGITKRFNKPLYLSEITARLVKTILNVEDQYLNVIKLRNPISINNIDIVALDANHCPGAIMFVFRLPNGKTILHTGDFRAHSGMESEPIFWNYDFDIIYLDTTYLSSKYIFKSQWESIKIAQEFVSEYGKKVNWQNFLIVVGSYLIGKEKLWLNIAEYFKFKVWMDRNRRKVLACINDSKLLNIVIDNPNEAQIHILPINKVHYDFLLDYLKGFDKYEHILAIIPSGWQKNNIKPIIRGHITILGIEYSEHSSFDEMKRFVRFLRPKKVISTVPSSGKDLSKTPKIPKNWLTEENPIKLGYQQSITNFFKIIPDTNSNQHSDRSNKTVLTDILTVDITIDDDKITIKSKSVSEINLSENGENENLILYDSENDWMF